MKQQVVPLLLEWKDILSGGSHFLLDLRTAGGMSFWGVFFFFLASPFSFLAAFVEKGDVYLLCNVLVLAKLSLSAGTAAAFVQEEQPELERPFVLFLSCSYALCGYGLLYYQNLVWLDVLCLFPILMLGFRRLIYSCKVVLFTASLTAVIVINYYLSYMVLLALILLAALFIKNCVPVEKRGEIAGKIGLCAALSLLITSVVWLPSLLQCLRSARTSQGIASSIREGRLLTEWSTTLPVLFCTAMALAVPVLGLAAPRTPKRRALLWGWALTSLPLMLEPVNKLWHTGSYQAFPARYGYIPVFLSLWYAADILQVRSRLGKKRSEPGKGHFVFLGLPLLLACVGASILWLKWGQINSYTSTLWFDDESFFYLAVFGLLACAMALFVFSGLFRRRGSRRTAGTALLLLCLAQGAFHSAVLLGAPANVPERERQILSTEGAVSDDGLYRVKLDSKFCDVNLLGAAGHNTLDHYTSLTDESFLHAMKKLGYSSYWMETSSCCGTGISDALLSNKYVLTPSLKLEKTGGGNLGYILPIGTFPETMPEGSRFAQQNQLYRLVLESAGRPPEEAFRQHQPAKQVGAAIERAGDKTVVSKTGGKGLLLYEIDIGEEETLYFDAFCDNTNRLRESINGFFHVAVNGEPVAENYPSQGCNGILKLGTFRDQRVSVEIELKQDSGEFRSFGVYGLASEKEKAFTGCLVNASLWQEGNKIVGNASTNQEGRALFLSVPYAPGMKAKVNDKPVEIRRVLDCFMEIPLEKGENRVELSYLPQGVAAGAALSVLGLSVSGLLLLPPVRRRVKKLQKLWYKTAWPLLCAAFCAVLVLIYLLPIGVWLTRFL